MVVLPPAWHEPRSRGRSAMPQDLIGPVVGWPDDPFVSLELVQWPAGHAAGMTAADMGGA